MKGGDCMFKKLLEKLYRKATKELYQQIYELEMQLNKFKQQLEELQKPDIEIDLVDDSEIGSTPKSVRVNYYVWEDWQQFCECHEDFSKKQLVSMALKEFMKKHQ
jgi:hypothetical protein